MKKSYTSIFITSIPSFYKLNLYNAINQKQDILVIFTGDMNLKRESDFFKGKYDFDYIDMSGWTTFKKICELIKTLTKFEYNELVIGGWDSIPLLITPYLSAKKKNSVVVESSYLESTLNGIKGFVKRMFFHRISKAYASGKSQKTLIENITKKKIEIVITKGVGVFNFIPQPKFIPKDKVVNFIYVGRLSPEKNLLFTIDAFRDCPDLKLNIVGYGPQEAELRENVPDNVNFLGGIDNDKLSKIYQQNDVFILPSISEPWGLVVEEALNNGLPLLLSNRVGCAEELLIEGVNGYSFKYDDKQSLLKAVRMISDPDTYNSMAEQISHMNFEEIENKQVNCYIHE